MTYSENMTYEAILQQMLRQVPDLVDKREGSLIYDTLSPVAAELAKAYLELDVIMDETFVDTASMYGLIKRCAERGVPVKDATFAVVEGTFTPKSLEIPLGTRFNCGDQNYAVVEKLEDGVYQLEAETEGTGGNLYSGTLLPIDHVNGLESGAITGVLIPAEDGDTAETLRQRYYDSIDSLAYGGNVADYKSRVNLIDGVGGVKVRREWNGDIHPADFVPPEGLDSWLESQQQLPEEIKKWVVALKEAAGQGLLTVGGAVRLIIIDAAYKKPSQVLVEKVQEAIDPTQSHGEGLGIAPIGHYVTVTGVEERSIQVATNITFVEGSGWDTAKSAIKAAVEEYFAELRTGWENEDVTVVRISQIENKILGVPAVLDIADTTLDGLPQNIQMEEDKIPILGEVGPA